jgi:hypothetical protein
MANNPPTVNVVKYKGSGNPAVFPLLPTQVLGTQDGSDLGTGGPGLATLATTIPAGTFSSNKVIEFLGDRYVLTDDGSGSGATTGVYKKNSGGAGQWGRVRGGEFAGDTQKDGDNSGLFVLHPAGVPTLAYMQFDGLGELRIALTIDGTTGANWGANQGILLETNASSPATMGQAIVFRDSIFWIHHQFTGGAGAGSVTSYDLNTTTLTRSP